MMHSIQFIMLGVVVEICTHSYACYLVSMAIMSSTFQSYFIASPQSHSRHSLRRALVLIIGFSYCFVVTSLLISWLVCFSSLIRDWGFVLNFFFLTLFQSWWLITKLISVPYTLYCDSTWRDQWSGSPLDWFLDRRAVPWFILRLGEVRHRPCSGTTVIYNVSWRFEDKGNMRIWLDLIILTPLLLERYSSFALMINSLSTSRRSLLCSSVSFISLAFGKVGVSIFRADIDDFWRKLCHVIFTFLIL